MLIELVKDKVFCQIFAKDFTESTGIYNIHKASSENLTEIAGNLKAIKTSLKIDAISVLNQIHSNKIVQIDWHNYQASHEADASITTQKSLALSIMTADCVPVLFSNAQGTVIAAAHCGWKGTKKDIIKSVKHAFLKMQQNDLPQDDIVALIGPAIHQQSYEVDESYYQNFINDNDADACFFIPSDNIGHWMFDLIAFVKAKLQQENIKTAYVIDENTYAMPEKYSSYRFCCHNNMTYRNNILSTIFIK
jgi:YfiH family protein